MRTLAGLRFAGKIQIVIFFSLNVGETVETSRCHNTGGATIHRQTKDKIEDIKKESFISVVTYFLKLFLRDLSHFLFRFCFIEWVKVGVDFVMGVFLL